MLKLLSYSPIDRRAAYPEAWQGVRENQQESYGLGNRRPLHYVQDLRQSHTELQSNDQVQTDNWQSPQGRSLPDSYDEMHYQPSLYDQTQQWSAVAAKWPEETLPLQPPPPMPRGLNFNVEFPFGPALGQKKEHSSNNEGSNVYSGGRFGVGYSSDVNKPSIQINAGKHAHTDSKPRLQFSVSLPIPPPVPSSKPSRGDVTSGLKPGKTILQEHHIHKPLHPKPTDGIIVSSGHDGKPTTPTESQGKIPTEYSWELPKYTAPPLPISFYQQPDRVFSGHYVEQINPTIYSRLQSGQRVLHKPNNAHVSLFPSQYERHHSFGHIKPSNNFGQHQTWQPDGTRPSFAPFRPSHGGSQIVETLPSRVWPSYPTGSQSPYEHPFGNNKEVATTNYAMGNVMQQSHSSSYPHQNSMGHSGWVVLPGPLSTFDTDRRQMDGKSTYPKLFINA